MPLVAALIAAQFPLDTDHCRLFPLNAGCRPKPLFAAGCSSKPLFTAHCRQKPPIAALCSSLPFIVADAAECRALLGHHTGGTYPLADVFRPEQLRGGTNPLRHQTK